MLLGCGTSRRTSNSASTSATSSETSASPKRGISHLAVEGRTGGGDCSTCDRRRPNINSSLTYPPPLVNLQSGGPGMANKPRGSIRIAREKISFEILDTARNAPIMRIMSRLANSQFIIAGNKEYASALNRVSRCWEIAVGWDQQSAVPPIRWKMDGGTALRLSHPTLVCVPESRKAI